MNRSLGCREHRPPRPDHTEEATLFRLLDVPAAGVIHLTGSFALLPTAAVSGWYIAHPEAKSFGVGKSLVSSRA